MLKKKIITLVVVFSLSILAFLSDKFLTNPQQISTEISKPDQESSEIDQKNEKIEPYHILSTDLATLINQKDQIVIIDVRFKEEYDAAHLEGAKFFPLSWINETKLQKENFNKADKIILYSYTDDRSRSARKKLIELGYQNVFTLKGGIKRWLKEELPTIKSQN